VKPWLPFVSFVRIARAIGPGNTRAWWGAGAYLSILLFAPRSARAGMPGISLSDIATARLDAISFFAVAFLICAWVVKAIWNGLRRDFPRMPVLSYWRSAGLVFVWGLLFLLVLTMISGARELMTPGAWRKQGYTYQLPGGKEIQPLPAADVAVTDEGSLMLERFESLQRLHEELTRYAQERDGRYPTAEEFESLPGARSVPPSRPGWHYRYVAGGTPGDRGSILVYEPNAYGGRVLALDATGRIHEMNPALLKRLAATSTVGQSEASP